MARFRNKPREVEVMTFQELIEFGKASTDELINGKPISFEYNGHLIQYQNEQTHLINTLESGNCPQIFSIEDMLIIGLKGEIYPCKKDIFEMTYERVD